jgi:hypothetical protein
MAGRRELRIMIEGQGYRCAATGIELTPEVASLDHKVPRCDGGTNDFGNLHIVHDIVNKAKGSLGWDDFVAMCHAVARTHDDVGVEWCEATARRRAARAG